MGPALPQAFLEAATPGYLTGTEWDQLAGDEDWLEQALAYSAVPCKGVRGPLTRVRSRPARSRATGSGSGDSGEQLASGPASIAGGPLYRLADYLDQHGRQHRKGQFPRRASGPQRQITPCPATRPRLVTPPWPAACTVTPPSCTKTPPSMATSALFGISLTLRTTSVLTTARCAGPPPTSPSMTRAAAAAPASGAALPAAATTAAWQTGQATGPPGGEGDLGQSPVLARIPLPVTERHRQSGFASLIRPHRGTAISDGRRTCSPRWLGCGREVACGGERARHRAPSIPACAKRITRSTSVSSSAALGGAARASASSLS